MVPVDSSSKPYKPTAHDFHGAPHEYAPFGEPDPLSLCLKLFPDR